MHGYLYIQVRYCLLFVNAGGMFHTLLCLENDSLCEYSIYVPLIPEYRLFSGCGG